jgi:hypothetical protein
VNPTKPTGAVQVSALIHTICVAVFEDYLGWLGIVGRIARPQPKGCTMVPVFWRCTNDLGAFAQHGTIGTKSRLLDRAPWSRRATVMFRRANYWRSKSLLKAQLEASSGPRRSSKFEGSGTCLNWRRGQSACLLFSRFSYFNQAERFRLKVLLAYQGAL